MVIIAVFTIWVSTLQFFKGEGLVVVVYRALLIIGKCSFIEYEIRKNPLQFCKHLYVYCFVLTLINLITIFLLPKGIYDSGGWGYYYLLGNHNGYIVIIFPGVCAGYYILKNKIIKKRNYLSYWIAVIATYYMERSVTSIIGLALLVGFVLFLNYRFLQAFLNGPIYILLAAGINYFVVFYIKNNSYLWLALLAMLNKSSTVSGRVIVWNRAISEMSKSGWMLLGLPNNELQNWLDGMHLYHVHNMVLEISFQAGIFGLLLWIILLILTAYNLSQTYYDKISRMLGCAFFALLIMLVTDFYGYPTIFSILVMINTICAAVRRKPVFHSFDYVQIQSMDEVEKGAMIRSGFQI